MVVLVLCVLVLKTPLREFLRVPASFLLQQGHHNLSFVTHSQPEFGVAAIAAAVPAAASRVPSGPPTCQLVAVSQ